MNLRPTSSRGLALTATVGLLLTLPGAPAMGDRLAVNQPVPAPDWQACPTDVVTVTPLECATVSVPLDQDKPDGTQIEIMISRLAGHVPEKRQGVLLTNPGGPGTTGLTMPADLVGRGVPASVLNAFDVIGMDPRGVGHSAPVSCGFTVDQAYRGNVPPYAPDAAAVAEDATAAKQVADQCAAHDPEGRMAHMTTANSARDMDLIRAALGEERLSFFGASYGSALGSAYASLFPERGDRIVIDSNLGSTSLDRDSLRRFARGVEDRFPDFARWAAKRHESYGLGRTPHEVRAGYLNLADRLDREPVDGFDGAAFRFYMFVGLYADSGFGTVAQIWQSLANSDAESARRQAQTLETSAPNAPSSIDRLNAAPGAPASADNAWSAYLAYTCNDTDWPEDVATYQRDVAADRQRFPLFGAASANVTPCAFWHDPVDPPVEFSTAGPRNVLVLQNLRDPATPHLGGWLARKAFGDRAALVSVDDGGHGVYVYGGNACALNTATSFLLGDDLPHSPTLCRASD